MDKQEVTENAARILRSYFDNPKFKLYNDESKEVLFAGILRYVYNEGFQNGKKLGFENGLKAGQRETKLDVINKFKKLLED